MTEWVKNTSPSTMTQFASTTASTPALDFMRDQRQVLRLEHARDGSRADAPGKMPDRFEFRGAARRLSDDGD